MKLLSLSSMRSKTKKKKDLYLLITMILPLILNSKNTIHTLPTLRNNRKAYLQGHPSTTQAAILREHQTMLHQNLLMVAEKAL